MQCITGVSIPWIANHSILNIIITIAICTLLPSTSHHFHHYNHHYPPTTIPFTRLFWHPTCDHTAGCQTCTNTPVLQERRRTPAGGRTRAETSPVDRSGPIFSPVVSVVVSATWLWGHLLVSRCTLEQKVGLNEWENNECEYLFVCLFALRAYFIISGMWEIWYK